MMDDLDIQEFALKFGDAFMDGDWIAFLLLYQMKRQELMYSCA